MFDGKKWGWDAGVRLVSSYIIIKGNVREGVDRNERTGRTIAEIVDDENQRSTMLYIP